MVKGELMVHDADNISDSSGLRQHWFRVQELDPGIVSISEPLHEEVVSSFLILGELRALLIDTGMGVGDIRAVVEDHTSLPVTVVNSHAHWDHIGGNHRFDEIVIHQAEAHELPEGVGNDRLRKAFATDRLLGPLPEGFDIEAFTIPPSVASLVLSGGERFDLGGRTLEVIHAPGHSPGGIVLLDRARGALFSTDVAYAGALYAFGRDADFAVYRQTMAMLAELAPQLKAVYGSHNTSPFAPELLLRMRDGMEAVAAGRQPDEMVGDVARHEFQGFSILVDADRVEAERR